MRVILTLLFLLCLGCGTTQITYPDIPETSKPLADSAKDIGSAAKGIEQANTTIKVENAAPAPDKTIISKQTDVIQKNVNVIQNESVSLTHYSESTAALEKTLKESNELNAKLQERIDDLTEQAGRVFKWLLIGAVACTFALAGFGAYTKNLRLIFAAPIAGAITVGVILLGSIIYEYRVPIFLTLMIGGGVASVVVLLGLYREWKKDKKKNVANLFRAVDK